MSKVDYSTVYNEIIAFMKQGGVKVVHRKLNDCYGCFHHDTVSITMDTAGRNTYDGCFFLLHEFAHYLQWKEPKWKWFFKIPHTIREEDVEMWLFAVESAEVDADERAAEMLMDGWGLKHTSRFTLNDLESKRTYWKKHYWRIK